MTEVPRKAPSDSTEVLTRLEEALAAVTPAWRSRVLTYGPDAARLVLRSFDDLCEMLNEMLTTRGAE